MEWADPISIIGPVLTYEEQSRRFDKDGGGFITSDEFCPEISKLMSTSASKVGSRDFLDIAAVERNLFGLNPYDVATWKSTSGKVIKFFEIGISFKKILINILMSFECPRFHTYVSTSS